VTLAGGKAYTAAATGLLGGGTAALSAAPAAAGLSLFDDSAAPTPGNGSLRVVHLSPNAPAVDVLSGETALATGLSFGQSRSLELAPSTLAYRVALAGGGATVLSGRATILAGSASSIFVLGLAGEAPADQGLRAIATADAVGGAPSARFTVLLPVLMR
jgi:hypothetical protein